MAKKAVEVGDLIVEVIVKEAFLLGPEINTITPDPDNLAWREKELMMFEGDEAVLVQTQVKQARAFMGLLKGMVDADEDREGSEADSESSA